MLAVRNEDRTQNWAMVIPECNSSGGSSREFYIQREVSEKTYYYYLRKLRSQMSEAAAPKLVQLEPAPVPILDDMLQIQYRDAELRLPTGVEYGHGCSSASIPSVATIALSNIRNFYVACGYTDLRLGIDDLIGQYEYLLLVLSMLPYLGKYLVQVELENSCPGI